jgi:hypothetical protein
LLLGVSSGGKPSLRDSRSPANQPWGGADDLFSQPSAQSHVDFVKN